MSSGEAVSSAFRRFASSGRTPCTRCRSITPEGETIQALPPSEGQPRWTSHRCFPACNQPPQSAASRTPVNTVVFKQQFGGTPCSQCGKPIPNGEMMQADKTRGIWRNKRHVRCPPPPAASSRGVAAAPTRLDMGGTKRPHSSLGGGGSGSRVSGTAKKPRAPAGAGSTTPLRTPSNSPWSQPTTAVVAPRATSALINELGVATEALRAAAERIRAANAAAARARAQRRGGGDDGDGVEVVRQVSVEERIAENQRKQGVIDLGGDEDGGVIDITDDDDFVALTPPSVPTPPTSTAGTAAKGGKNGGGKKGGGISRNLAVTEGWTEKKPPRPDSFENALAAMGKRNKGWSRQLSTKGGRGRGSLSDKFQALERAPKAPPARPPAANGGGGKPSLSAMFQALEQRRSSSKKRP